LSKNTKNVIDKEQTSLGPQTQPDGIQRTTGEEVYNDEMDNDLDGIIDEKKDCIRK
jgi:hypothetical protein